MDLESFNKYIIMPKLSVYKNCLDKDFLKKIINAIKNNETDISEMKKFQNDSIDDIFGDGQAFKPILHNDDNPLDQWTPWYDFGSRTLFNNKKNNSLIINKDYQILYNFKDEFYKILNKIYEDYIKDWKDSDYWPSHLKGWELNSNHSGLTLGSIELLKHDIVLNKKFAIEYHTDSHEEKWMQPLNQQLLTIILYLNDDYEGGEVDFINEKDNKLITYKPESGDITIFPSGLPYWHAAKAVTKGNNKFFIRVFVSWTNPGSPEWYENIKKYGEEKWKQIYSEMIDKERKSKVTNRVIIKDGEIYNSRNEQNSLPIYISAENEIYINSKDFNNVVK
jgi:hypothetical protein